MEKRLFEHSLAIILLTMRSYLGLKQYKWIIMLMAQFGFRIWWQAVFLDDRCSDKYSDTQFFFLPVRMWAFMFITSQ